jgi:hypothetical protein
VPVTAQLRDVTQNPDIAGVPLRTGIIGVGVVAVALLGWQTRSVRREFTHPEITMFRRYVADPIPSAVRNLAPGGPGSFFLHNSAVVAFEAPDSIVRGILDHSLPGSTALAFLSDLKSRNGRDTTSTFRVGAPGGSDYVRVDSTSFTPELESTFSGAHLRTLEGVRAGHEVYVLAQMGEWGRFESVLTYDRSQERVLLRQLAIRAPVELD